MVFPVETFDSSVASLIRWASPPESSVEGCPSLTYPKPTSYSVWIFRRITAKTQEGSARVIEKKGEHSAWQATANEKPEPVDEAKLNALFTLLANLKAKRIEKFGLSLEDLQTYGFRQPWFELTVDVESADAVRAEEPWHRAVVLR